MWQEQKNVVNFFLATALIVQKCLSDSINKCTIQFNNNDLTISSWIEYNSSNSIFLAMEIIFFL